MKTLAAEQRELIDAVVAERDVGNISAAIFEKDVHITDVLRTLFEKPLHTEDVELVFCGGTSLSKGFGWTHRMSEDLDFKVCSANELSKCTRKQVRSELRARLDAIGLATDPESWRVHNNSRQVVMAWCYESQYAVSTALRPYLQIELRFDGVRQTPVTCPVAALLAQHIEPESRTDLSEPFSIACQHPGETLAEKVMAYLRRSLIAESKRERSLVRHLHDIYAMVIENPGLLDVATRLFPDIAIQEQRSYRKQFPEAEYVRPMLEAALAATEENEEARRDEYEGEVVPLLFTRDQFCFEEVLDHFRRVAQQCIESLPRE